MFRTTMAVLFLATAGVMFVSAQGEDADLKKLQGAWSVTSLVDSGKAFPKEVLEKIQIEFKVDGKKYEVHAAGKKLEAGETVLNPSKSPKQIDQKITEESEGNDKGKTQLGIYKLENDVLYLTFAKPGATTRPTSFEKKDDEMIMHITLKKKVAK